MDRKDFKLTEAKVTDSQAVWEIRFSDAARKMSGGSLPVPFSEHDNWFKKQYFSGLQNHCLLVKVGDQAVAYCRLDQVSPAGYTVSIAVSPNWQNQGIGKWLLSEVVRERPAPLPYFARIYRNNLSSQKIFTGCGFVIDHVDNDVDYYRLR